MQFRDLNIYFVIKIWCTLVLRSGCLKQARCVVTNTFHGTVFAIIHHKPFLCILQRGSSANQNTRMSSLLSTLGLEDRILNCEDSIEVSINRPINWQKVSTLITDWRKKSDAFLNFLND